METLADLEICALQIAQQEMGDLIHRLILSWDGFAAHIPPRHPPHTPLLSAPTVP